MRLEISFVSHEMDLLVIQNMTRCIGLYVHTKKEYMCQCIHICTYIYISVYICAYKYNIGMNMYTCVFMYIHIRQDKYMCIMIHTYVYIYTCGFSVCVWVGEKICVASRYSHNLIFIDPKKNMKKLWKYDKRISVIKNSVGVIGLVSRDMDHFVLCIGTPEWKTITNLADSIWLYQTKK